MKQYLIFAAVIAGLFGLYKWEGMKTKAARLEAEAVRRSLAMAEVELKDAAATADHNKDVAESFKAEVSRQREIAAAEAKKSRQRLDAYNALNRKIANVPTSQNVPVSDHVQSVLDSIADELRGDIPRDGSGAGSADETPDSGEPADSGPNLPAEAPTS